jgi:putative flippase GtrA
LAHNAFTRYVIAYVIGYLINFGLLAIGVDHLNLPHQIVQAVAIVIVASSLFLMHKFWVFTQSRDREPI